MNIVVGIGLLIGLLALALWEIVSHRRRSDDYSEELERRMAHEAARPREDEEGK